MNIRSAALVLTAACSAVASAQSSEFHRTLEVSPRVDLYVSTGAGNVVITPSADGRLTVFGHVHTGWHLGGAADRVARIAADPPIRQSGDTVRIGEPPNPTLLNNITIDYEIQAPRDAALNLRSGSGDIRTTDVGRFLAAHTGSGTVVARGVHGPAQLHSGSGDIQLNETAQGEVQAQTGSGSIQLHGLNGPLQAHTGSGGIDAEGRLQGPGELSTGSGSIHLRVTPDSRFDLKAHTGSGSIRTHVPGMSSVDVDHHRVSGAVNGGGPEIEIHTGSGDIEIDAEGS